MKPFWFLDAGFALILITAVTLAPCSSPTHPRAIDANITIQGAKLTDAEEHDLRELIPQTLSWIAIWHQPLTCLVDKEFHPLDFAAAYTKLANKEIDLKIEIRQRSVEVALDALHTALRFERLYNVGLSPARVNVFCENTYSEYKAGVARMQESNRKHAEENPPRDPKAVAAAETLNRLRQLHPTAPEDLVIGTEVRRYIVPTKKDAPTAPAVAPANDKNLLIDRILDEVRKQPEFACPAGKKVDVTMPDFELGDPAVYVLVEGASDLPRYIEWIDFGRGSSGQSTVQHVKSFSLPDEIESFVRSIKENPIRHLKLSCTD